MVAWIYTLYKHYSIDDKIDLEIINGITTTSKPVHYRKIWQKLKDDDYFGLDDFVPFIDRIHMLSVSEKATKSIHALKAPNNTQEQINRIIADDIKDQIRDFLFAERDVR